MRVAIFAPEGDPHLGRPGVPVNVAERFLNYAEKRRLDF